MPATPPRLLVALYGPTSAGKTKVSVELCLRLRDELGLDPLVISADSRQVYRYMDIGTSKTTPAEMRGIPHAMLDVTEPVRKLELETYVAQARRRMDACWAAGGVPVVVGGTGVYVRSLLEGWEVDAVAEARASLRRDFPRSMAADAHEVLARLDKQAAAKVHANNYDGVINALAHAVGNDPERAVATVPTRTVMLGVDRPAADIDRRVAETYDDQVRRGLRDEVLGLEQRYDLLTQYRRLGKKTANQVVHTHGYTEWFDVALERGLAVEKLGAADQSEVRQRVVERIQAHTKRQRAVFPKLAGLKMVRGPGDAFDAVVAAQRAEPPKPAATGKPGSGGRSGAGQPGAGKAGSKPSGRRPARPTGKRR
ncbi:tRNA isopentenyltransferase [Kribbella flavida DSM 17836]|uniref:tRNA dimethylallyltransferase n=1 Tax=Kribbella flavida (strain DSM 17836 / JCM 10339 / NBRC 14399) TaxID=479435 RepID=D2PSX0_KRIFD|nr:tRNA isopentenyltransferase [Kribbella flavida]ADB35022.1 tRNA isopentenyltransferase [Kribbella flavida DSM 17836]